MLRQAVLSAALLLLPAAVHASCPPTSTMATHVFAGGLCVVVNTYGAEQAGEAPVLLIAVHGDISDGGLATYHARFAQEMARPGVLAVALTRPGYPDMHGRRSEGHDLGREDNYTPQAVTAIGAAIDALKKHYRARRVVYVGHSGGAAIGGVLLGRQPGLIDTALLVSCPCNLARYRAGLKLPPFTRSLSPSDFVHRVPKETEVIAMTGTADVNTFPELARDYIADLAARGVNATFVPVEHAEHGFSTMTAAAAAELNRVLGR